jgi:hypothetical protein
MAQEHQPIHHVLAALPSKHHQLGCPWPLASLCPADAALEPNEVHILLIQKSICLAACV